MTDRRRIPHPELILRSLPEGACVVLRDYDDPSRPALARRLASICRARNLFFSIGSDVALARKIGAALHLPSRMLHERTLPFGLAVSASCHTIEDIEAAASVGVRIIFLSPVFATSSHPGAECLGPAKFLKLAAQSPLPVLALGGVDESNAASLKGAGVAGIGAIGAFLAR